MKQTIEVAVAGGQPPDDRAPSSGKLMLAKRIATVMPPMTLEGD